MAVPSLAGELIPHAHIPRATYRFQFNAQFGFRDALALVPYLAALGISDCYASPIQLAHPGSMHGYDICDPTQINPELGGADGFAALSAALRDHGMGLLLDTVPNHMGIDSECNVWWMDVLENGPSSRYASYFDIDWHPVKIEIVNKVLLPLLGDHYGKALEQGALRLLYDGGAFYVNMYDKQRLPIAPRTYQILLNYGLPALREQLGEDHADIQELESIITALDHLPLATETDRDRINERYREKEVAKRRIAALCATSEPVRMMIDATVARFNGTPDDSASFDLLDDLLAQQSYRLAYWLVAAEEVNYRRFFDINTLGAVQVEDPIVFAAVHDLIFRLLREGHVTGLRIDHPDGLWNPTNYFRELQERYVREHAADWLAAHETDGVENPELRSQVDETLKAWSTAMKTPREGARDWPLYVVVEKILSEREPLPTDWPVYGTTGYDFMNGVTDIFVARENEREFTRLYETFTGSQLSYATLVNDAKHLIMDSALNSEINALGHQLERITERNRRYRDYTLNNLIYALHETIAYLQVYRTYTTHEQKISDRDERYITAAITEAKRQNIRVVEDIFDFLQDTLLLRNLLQFRPQDRDAVIDFVMNFQQMTGPIMAKSLEDTVFYRYNRLVSLNEVGGNPEQFGVSVSVFHEQNAARARNWPHSLLSSSTHDTKRSEDVRARINVLSEIPVEWEEALTRWRDQNAAFKAHHDGHELPSRNDEYLLYQTLLGIWPTEAPADWRSLRERIVAYMDKSIQEAKYHSSWVNPNAEYRAATRTFVERVIDPEGNRAFMDDFGVFATHVSYFGRFNGLAQMLLKVTAPGVPDFYQGTELWDHSLVDPDNRRPIDYALRQHYLNDLRSTTEAAGADRIALCHDLLTTSVDGRVKLYVAQAALALRRDNDALFTQGSYRALEARGDHWKHVCAFARQHMDQSLIAVAPRLTAKLSGSAERNPLGSTVWEATWLTLPDDFAGRCYRNCFTGEEITVGEHDGVPGLDVADLLTHFPVALLMQC